MGKIKEIGEKYFSYLSNIPKNEWVTAYQTLPTYMYSSSSCAESFNSLILPYRCDSYDSLLLEIRNLFIKRKLKEEQNLIGKVTDIDNYEKIKEDYIISTLEGNKLSKYSNDFIKRMTLQTGQFTLERQSFTVYFVHLIKIYYIVEFKDCSVTCTCNFMKYIRFISTHILFVCIKCNLEYHHYIG